MDAAMNSKSARWWLIAILAIATISRIASVIWIEGKLKASGREFLISGDAEGYWELGRRLAYGEDYAVHDPPRYVHRMPGLPALLAVSITLFGESKFASRLFLSMLGVLACWLVYLLGKRLDSQKTGLIAAAIAAIAPTLIVFSGVVLSETPFTVALLLSLLVGCRLFDLLTQHSDSASTGKIIQEACLVGALIGLGVYMKPSWILAGPLLALLIAIGFHPFTRSLFAAICLVAAMIAVLLPWGVRNAVISGHFTLTTFWMGPSLYDGVQPGATGASDMTFFDRDQLPLHMSEFAVDREYRQRAKQLALDDPGRMSRLAGAKFLRFWNLVPNADQFQNRWIYLGMSVFYLPILTFSLVGGFAWQRRFWSLVICVGPVIYFTGIHLIFVSSLRYRLPAEYPLFILTAVGIQAVVTKISGSRIPEPSSNRN